MICGPSIRRFAVPAHLHYAPPPDQPRILHVDPFLLIVSKPAGLLSVPGRGADKADCLVARLQANFPGALIVHRLDMGTSGLMVLARDADSHRALSRLFASRAMYKRYEACVQGLPIEDAGTVTQPLITDWPNRPRQKIDLEIGKPALTHFRILARDPQADYSRVELEPHTGRSHQLRVHMQYLGHPILGDELYGVAASAPRLLLHATTLAFTHPATGQNLRVHEDAPF